MIHWGEKGDFWHCVILSPINLFISATFVLVFEFFALLQPLVRDVRLSVHCVSVCPRVGVLVCGLSSCGVARHVCGGRRQSARLSVCGCCETDTPDWHWNHPHGHFHACLSFLFLVTDDTSQELIQIRKNITDMFQWTNQAEWGQDTNLSLETTTNSFGWNKKINRVRKS